MRQRLNNTMNTKILIIALVVIAILVLGYWWWQKGGQLPELPYGQQQESSQASDDTASLEAGLNAIQEGNTDSEFQEVDAEINSL